jgi:3-phosphoshikimate 1-carboxyvinyltransferase
MNNVISPPKKPVQDTIYLPSSKSISNRVLIISALEGKSGSLDRLSESDDTRVLQEALDSGPGVKDVGHAGTAMRFLTAYCTLEPGRIILTGSDRMKQRPLYPLIGALRELGAKIECLEKEGYPPVRITGGLIKGGAIDIDGGISSQFISALMMLGPRLKGGLKLSLSGQVVSETYIRMTLALMKDAGVMVSFDGRQITVPEMDYHLGDFTVEADWSSASYWYQIAALLPGSILKLPHLQKGSVQGDSVLAGIFSHLGVTTRFGDDGIELRSAKGHATRRLDCDFIGSPDLVQTCAVTCCALHIPFRFTGTSTLLIKETDRIAALQSELGKLGYILSSGPRGEWISWDGSLKTPLARPVIQTYHDHRMAMAFAPLSIATGRIAINDPDVVTKSYPGYWSDLEKAGFGIIGSGE